MSSRSKKSDTPASRHPENYMDDEVCHGIVCSTIETCTVLIIDLILYEIIIGHFHGYVRM